MRRSQTHLHLRPQLSLFFNGGATDASGEVHSTRNTNTTVGTTAPLETTVSSNNEEEWATKLQPISIELDLVPGPEGVQRCNGLGSDPTASLACFGSSNAISNDALNLGGFPDSWFLSNANNSENGKIGSVIQSSSVELVNNREVLDATSR
ncbi:hypothetical protein V6N13_001649 [Hibiscus sabdariffa]|uniref:Uncharacterized protein n=1 Tax=Hibiscus sabdariffa TaxID=183260 RepID=A0ABR2G8X3_9ROSI